MLRTLIPTRFMVLLATVGFSLASCQAQSVPGNQPSSPTTKPTGAGSPFRNQPSRMANRAHAYYESVWGIDGLSVKVLESGEMLRFSYRVLDPAKAKALNEKRAEPALIEPDKGVKLVIPSMEKIGQLRQSATPEAGKSYWMAFSNKGGIVKRGDRVNIVIGNFHANSLQVE